MPVIGVRQFAQQVSRLVADVERTREPVVITRHGRAVALVVPVDAGALERHVLAGAPAFARARGDA